MVVWILISVQQQKKTAFNRAPSQNPKGRNYSRPALYTLSNSTVKQSKWHTLLRIPSIKPSDTPKTNLSQQSLALKSWPIVVTLFLFKPLNEAQSRGWWRREIWYSFHCCCPRKPAQTDSYQPAIDHPVGSHTFTQQVLKTTACLPKEWVDNNCSGSWNLIPFCHLVCQFLCILSIGFPLVVPRL